ncbi:YfcE family phosphodiesterase [Staphylococcus carnosus]|uniref:Phosphoesterase n=2 Tax=Staphylococcus carnosus TaxID=1281 RepID=A0AAJ0NH45_STACA|nr:metallophosphoesterase [Staphylococcus carnosus]ANZ33638.1 YfcE family phosphodiesterase [Staphylococcus carnosus]KKB24431.1 phosphoesterase [Staphylococcus carnosus]KOR12005.1 phosphoesterase [Staphylococcus carnosus]POA00272.1 metallophosphoesterase [Staphylococcus carnosus]QQS85564.1 metallophosphoesterase [Staphylococcus carnosus]
MNRWLILSDNHTEPGILFEIFNHYDEVDVAIHLGDSEFQFDDTELSLYRRVKGNCDFYPEFPAEEIVEADGVRAFYTHGHMYSVNTTRMQLAEKAKSLECQLAFYGHTHIARYEEIAGVHVINPGSISQSRSRTEETYAELLIDDNEKDITLNFRNRQHAIIDTVEFKI